MSRKIENPIREGLISQIYLLAFPERKTPYKIAKEIYGTIAEGRKTAKLGNKIYEPVKKFSYLFDRNMEGILSNSDYLLKELVKDMERTGITLNHSERQKLKQFLDNEFRKYLKIQLYKKDWKSVGGYNVFIECLRDVAIPLSYIYILGDFGGKSFFDFIAEKTKTRDELDELGDDEIFCIFLMGEKFIEKVFIKFLLKDSLDLIMFFRENMSSDMEMLLISLIKFYTNRYKQLF